jgi:hypothetical protein
MGMSITRRHIAQRAARGHGAEGDDLGYLIVAVFAGAVFEHFGAAVVAEVEVDVGHRDAARVEETLKEQVVLDRVDQGDEQGVGDDRSGRRTARVVPDIIFSSVAAQIPHDQEVGVEAHLVDDAQLEIEPLTDFGILFVLTVALFARFRTGGAGRFRR